MILLRIGWELELDPLIEIVDGMKGYNFELDCLRYCFTVYDIERHQLALSGLGVALMA